MLGAPAVNDHQGITMFNFYNSSGTSSTNSFDFPDETKVNGI